MKKIVIAAAFAALTANPLVAGIRFDASMEVAIAPKASGPVQFAAQEMTNFLSRAFGKRIPIVRKVNPAKATIVLGTNAWSEAVGVDISKLRRDGYRMKTSGNALYIAGADAGCSLCYCLSTRNFERGTMMGAYAFLEKYAGCRFYFPGELGEVVPTRYAISVPDLDFSDSPAFAERRYSYHDAGAWYDETLDKRNVEILKDLNRYRLRLSTRMYITCHGLRNLRLGHRFKETHPEYFMLQKDGTRYLRDTEQRPDYKNCKLCFSNPELREVIYQDIKAYVTKQPPQSRGLNSWNSKVNAMIDHRYVGVQPEDGFELCQCERCKAACRTDLGTSFATDLMWGFTKELAERLNSEGLDAVLMQSAYSAWEEPPSFDMPQNLAISVDTYGPWVVRNPKKLKANLARLEKWTKKLGHGVLTWVYAGKFGVLGFGSLMELPAIAPRAYGMYYKMAAPFLSGEFAGVYNETKPGRFLYDSLNVYVLSRVAWDPSVDVDAILDEHYRLMYGAAAKEMQSIFETLEDLWLDRICGGKTVHTNLGPKMITPNDQDIWTDIYSPAKIGKLLAKADAAAAKVKPGSIEARRIALVRTEILDRISTCSRKYNESISVEREKASRAARKPVNLVKDFKPVTLTVPDAKDPYRRRKFQIPGLKQGHRYRLSLFIKGENIVPLESGGGAQGIVWADESIDAGLGYPRSKASGTFDWMHFEGEYTVPEKGLKEFKPEVHVRMFRATGTAHFDGLLVEEVK